MVPAVAVDHGTVTITGHDGYLTNGSSATNLRHGDSGRFPRSRLTPERAPRPTERTGTVVAPTLSIVQWWSSWAGPRRSGEKTPVSIVSLYNFYRHIYIYMGIYA